MSGDMNLVMANVRLGAAVEIGHFSIVGQKRRRLSVKYPANPDEDSREPALVHIGDRTYIGHHALVYEGVTIGPDCFLDDYVRLGAFSSMGEGSMLLYGVKVYENVRIGRNCRIAGFVPNDVEMGDEVTMMGWIAHKYDRPLDWSRDEASPVIHDDVVVGMNSTIVGGITIGSGSYIAAGAILTKDVPSKSLVFNTNEIISVDEFESGRSSQ